jgi:hypothetical protein
MKIKKLKKSQLLTLSILVFSIMSCDLNEQDKVFRRQVTIETNLLTLKISDKNGTQNLDSNTVYPYILNDVYSPNLGGYGTIIYPVLDSGIIKLNIYGGEGYNSQLSFKDSMTIYTHVDTVYISINEYYFLRY